MRVRELSHPGFTVGILTIVDCPAGIATSNGALSSSDLHACPFFLEQMSLRLSLSGVSPQANDTCESCESHTPTKCECHWKQGLASNLFSYFCQPGSKGSSYQGPALARITNSIGNVSSDN